jgi:lipopolysaccharide transport system ATP-binding protein
VMGYLNHVAEKAEAARPEAERSITPAQLDQGQRWGTGRVKVVDVKLCDASGAERSIFATGAPMEIRLRYHSDLPIEDPIFGIAIHHNNGAWVTGPNTDFGNITIPLVDGDGEVVYRVPSLSLLAGGYTLSVAAVNRSDTEMYDYHDRAYHFQVHPGKVRERHGLVTLNGQWRVVDSAESPAVSSEPSRVLAA